MSSSAPTSPIQGGSSGFLDEFGYDMTSDAVTNNNNSRKRKFLQDLRRRSARFSLADDNLQSGKSSVRTSRRTSRAYTSSQPNSVNTTRRTSLSVRGERGNLYDMDNEGSVLDSLRGLCSESMNNVPDLAVACDHSVFLIKRDHRASFFEMKLVAGNVSEYGYKDAVKGTEARFSSLKLETEIEVTPSQLVTNQKTDHFWRIFQHSFLLV